MTLKHGLALAMLGAALVLTAATQPEGPAVVAAFGEGSAKLSADDAAKLRAFAANMEAKAKVEAFVVAAWADEDYPPAGKTLGDDAKKLANARAEAALKALQSGGQRDVETVAMVERPNWLQKALATEVAAVKGAARDGWLRAKGGPGKVVVTARLADRRGS